MNTFDQLSKHLNWLMTEQYIAVNQQKNPIIISLAKAKAFQLVYVIRQYSIFPRELVAFAQSARKTALKAGWLEVAAELQANIAEELGSTTQGISHYDLLAEGLEAGLQLPIKITQPSLATLRLLTSLQTICRQDASTVFGAMYAIEATSISELTMVMQIITKLIGGNLPDNLQYFFDMHLNEWEPEHEEKLRNTLAQCIDVTDFSKFIVGFCAVMEAMDLWWTELAWEANLQVNTLKRLVA
ncbi:DUF3865 domain-containing protein [Pantanalinema sp. GBBB05]|uniref:DUF3865 domain-containing protein n=1 Tax=Pantanalinema sp. GBBB05 TaxID=2604139 RepID=UPI001D95CC68|nr:DUF3865 domain-containing protein [Pantanalinema sp. GBBB05]